MISGVREYWIVDLNNNNIMLCGFIDLKIDDFQTFKVPDVLESYYFEGLQADLAKVFAP